MKGQYKTNTEVAIAQIMIRAMMAMVVTLPFLHVQHAHSQAIEPLFDARGTTMHLKLLKWQKPAF